MVSNHNVLRTAYDLAKLQILKMLYNAKPACYGAFRAPGNFAHVGGFFFFSFCIMLPVCYVRICLIAHIQGSRPQYVQLSDIIFNSE